MRAPPQAHLGRAATRRGAEELVRPIAAASGITLGAEHAQTIDESHQRCAALGVSRIERPDFATLGRADLTIARERNLRLHDHAAPVMEMLHEQIVNSNSMVVLTDASGTILHSIGDDDFLARASKVALAPGANWSESAKGTNAVGTALMAEAPTLVHADEHYLHANHFLTCSAAPILDPRGNILGVLDVSGDYRSYHLHTMALVKMSARMIENRWLTDDHRNAMRLHFHSRVEFIGTLMEGILAIGADGKIVGANRGALEQLGMSGAAVRHHTLSTLFGTTVDALVDRFRSPLATPAPLFQSQGQGRQFHVLARFNWPVWMSVAEAVAGTAPMPARDAVLASAKAAPPARTQPRAEGLASLCTGDVQMGSIVEKLRLALDRDIPFLLLGETGTGKEVLARAIHAESRRHEQAFVVLHCAAVPQAQLEAELFGHDDAAADATAAPGQLAQAQGGTLFIDDIDALPLAVQTRLAQALKLRRFAAAGGAAVANDMAHDIARDVTLDVTLICTSQHRLREAIDRGLFREELMQQIDGLTLRLPQLRERSDLRALVARILEQQNAGRRMSLADDALALFERYPWPGNVRELSKLLRTASVMAAGDAVITRAHLGDEFIDAAASADATLAMAPQAVTQAVAATTLGDMEIEAIRRAVELYGGNISRASKQLGISRNTIYRKLRWTKN